VVALPPNQPLGLLRHHGGDTPTLATDGAIANFSGRRDCGNWWRLNVQDPWFQAVISTARTLRLSVTGRHLAPSGNARVLMPFHQPLAASADGLAWDGVLPRKGAPATCHSSWPPANWSDRWPAARSGRVLRPGPVVAPPGGSGLGQSTARLPLPGGRATCQNKLTMGFRPLFCTHALTVRQSLP